MECKRIQKQMSDYRTGHLSPEECAVVEKHLAECTECQKVLQDEETISTFLRQTDEIESDLSVASELMQKLKQTERAERRTVTHHSRPFRAVVISLILLVFAAIGVLVMKFSKEDATYYPSYGPVGFTFVVDPDEDTGNLWETLPDSPAGNRYEHQIPMPLNQPDGDENQTDERVSHSFEIKSGKDEIDQTPEQDKKGL